MTATRSILRAGETEPLVVTSAGAPVASVQWASTDTSVVSIAASGLATAGRAGRVTITATSGSSSGTLTLRVVPDYQGTWTGGIGRVQLTCSAGSSAALCVPGAPTSGSLTLRVTQAGDQVQGVLTDSAEPTAQVALTGQVQADDLLALSGRYESPVSAPTLRIDVGTLRGSIDPAIGSMSGNYQWNVDRAATSGGTLQFDYRTQVQFRDLRR